MSNKKLLIYILLTPMVMFSIFFTSYYIRPLYYYLNWR